MKEKDLSRVREARAFSFRRGPVGCLLVHGITSTPFTVREMGEWLARHGISVMAPVMAGHARTWRHLEGARWQDWYADVEEAYDALRRRCRRVIAAGISMGGTQVLHLAAHRPELEGVIAMAPAMYLDDWRLKFLPVARYFMRFAPSIGGGVRDPGASREICTDRFPVRALRELMRMQAHLREEIHLVRCPVLAVQSRLDDVVPPGNARWVVEHVSSPRRRLIELSRSGHVITMDFERGKLFRAALSFMRGG